MELYFWGLEGIPSVYEMACINFIRVNVENYVHPYFKTKTWMRTFLGMIHSMPCQNNWPSFPYEDLLHPPEVKKLSGRPIVHMSLVNQV